MKRGEDYIAVGVVFFCHDGAGNVLLNKRGARCRDEQGRWDVGGGGVEWGETVEDALRKEIKEEYLAEVLSFEFLGFRDVHREHEGKKTHWVALDFKVLVDPIQAGNGEPEKFDEVRWFPWSMLPTPLHSQLPGALIKYKDKLQ